MTDDFKPLDVIYKDTPKGRRYVVCFPVRTRYGKLRCLNSNGNVVTTWWTLGHLPPKFVHVPYERDELHYTRGIGSGATHIRVKE